MILLWMPKMNLDLRTFEYSFIRILFGNLRDALWNGKKWEELNLKFFLSKETAKTYAVVHMWERQLNTRNSICVCAALLYIGRTKRLFQNLRHLNAKFLFGKCNKLTCRRSECEEIFCILSSNPFSMNQIPHECNSICKAT